MPTIDKWESEKKNKIDALDGFSNPNKLVSIKEIKASDEFKTWKAEVNQEYADKISELQEEMTVRFQEERSRQLPDYPIFMAIAENIGYDAVGKNTSKLISRNEEIEGNFKTITEYLSHDLFDERVSKKYDVHNEKEELSTKKEIIPSGILKELLNFINSINNERL